MNIKILFFGILKDIVGANAMELQLENNSTISKLKERLLNEHGKLNSFSNFSVAVNEEYVETNHVLKANDVVALIPPVSGG